MSIYKLPEELMEYVLIISPLELAQTCRYFLRLFSKKEVLIQIVEKYLRNAPHKLPLFLYASLPGNLLDVPFSLETNLCLDNCFLTGSYFLPQIYGCSPGKDIDVWINGSETEFKERYQEYTLDVVSKEVEPYSAISTFDLSICQQGMLFKEGEKIVHVTPLSLYTYYSEKIICTVVPLTRKYSDCRRDEYGTVLSCFFKHQKWCIPAWEKCSEELKKDETHHCWYCKFHKYFHRCDDHTGIMRDNRHAESLNTIGRWIMRLRKYDEKFPNYDFVYVLY